MNFGGVFFGGAFFGGVIVGGVDFSGASEQCSFGSGVVLFGGAILFGEVLRFWWCF